jgi:glycine cleavage system H protein
MTSQPSSFLFLFIGASAISQWELGDDMMIPDDLLYTSEHEWVCIDDAYATIGITSFAAAALGDVVFLELPAVGSRVTAGEPCGEIESTKSVSDIFAPLSGEVVEANDALIADPSLVNVDPYEKGWLIRIRFDHVTGLLDPSAYAALTAERP